MAVRIIPHQNATNPGTAAGIHAETPAHAVAVQPDLRPAIARPSPERNIKVIPLAHGEGNQRAGNNRAATRCKLQRSNVSVRVRA